MPTECISNPFEFEAFDGRRVVAAFDGGAISSDAGALLLRHCASAIGLFDRVAGVNGGGNMYRRGGAKMYHGLGGSLSA